MLKVGVDVRPLRGPMSGIPRVASNILRELISSGSEKYLLMDACPSPIGPVYQSFNEPLPDWSCGEFSAVQSPPGMNHNLDIFLSFYYPVPRYRPFPAVLFINDLIPVRFADTLGSIQQTRLFERIRSSAEFCERILTISQATKRDIVELWGLPEEKIEVVLLAAGDDFKPVSAQGGEHESLKANPTLQRYKISTPYLLSVCTLEPRKNLPRLLQAYEQVRARNKERLQLVLTGRLGWQYEELVRQLGNSPYSQDIVLTGFVPDRDLADLYRGARAFAFPSLYEGFGLPVLEAMSCGIPVMASNISSIPEVGGDCICYCDPYSIESMVRALETVLLDEEKRRYMAAAEIERARQFSWALAAAVVRKTFLQLTDNSNG